MRSFLLILIGLASAGYTISDADILHDQTKISTSKPIVKVEPLDDGPKAIKRTSVLWSSARVVDITLPRPGLDCRLPGPGDILPTTLSTESKYAGGLVRADGRTSTPAQVRAYSIDPIWRAIRKLEPIAASQGQHCALHTIAQWARSGALTVVLTSDAQVTRARMIAEIATLVADYERPSGSSADDSSVIAEWLALIGRDTARYFDEKAGPKTRRNNHRYWAGLALAQIGKLSDNTGFLDWAEKTYRIGVCQIDTMGLLPLELDRGALARNYHAYALRPLLATRNVLTSLGRPVDRYCPGALHRLEETTAMATTDTRLFEALTGLPQIPLPAENTYVSALRFDRLAVF